MGSAWVDHPSFELVGLASEITGLDLAHLLLHADLETLTRTDNAQIATFVQSLIVLDAAERLGIEPSAAAGHSLGEYTALVAAGSLDFEDGLRLVSERGAAIREAAECSPGTMIAVLGLDDESVETACRRVDGEAWIANFNAPGQVIVAGSSKALEEFAIIAKELGGETRALDGSRGRLPHPAHVERAKNGSERPWGRRTSTPSTRSSSPMSTPAPMTIPRSGPSCCPPSFAARSGGAKASTLFSAKGCRPSWS